MWIVQGHKGVLALHLVSLAAPLNEMLARRSVYVIFDMKCNSGNFSDCIERIHVGMGIVVVERVFPGCQGPFTGFAQHVLVSPAAPDHVYREFSPVSTFGAS